MMLLIMKLAILLQASTIAAVPWNGRRQDVLENAATVISTLASIPLSDGKLSIPGVTRPNVSWLLKHAIIANLQYLQPSCVFATDFVFISSGYRSEI